MAKLRLLGVAFVFLWFMLGGVGHFTNTAFFTAIVPPYIPFPVAAVYISGVIEVLAAIALLLPRTRRRAGTVLFLLTIAVTPANIHMWLHPELFPDISQTLLSLRLLIQLALLALIWWCSEMRLPKPLSRQPTPE